MATVRHSHDASHRVCPACGRCFALDYQDSFCMCGTELCVGEQAVGAAPSLGRPKPKRPAPGTRCLVLYGPEREPIHYFALNKDVLQIGRQDPVASCFPEIDVTAWLDEPTARKVSRQHALVLHSRQENAYYLRPLAGNTGTQLDTDMVPALSDYLLIPGTRLILGGAVRFKFEIM